MAFGIIFSVALALLMIVSMWKVFTKAGKPGWAVLIPFYNVLVMLEIVGKPWWWLLLIILVPIANLVFGIWMINLLSKSFGKSTGFTLGIIFLGIIFIPVLGLGKAEYKGPAGAKS